MSRAALGNLQNWLYCLVCALFVPVIFTENTATSSLGTASWEAGARACSVSMSNWKGGPTHHCSFASGWGLCKDKELLSAASRQRILKKESFRVLDASEKRIYTHMKRQHSIIIWKNLVSILFLWCFNYQWLSCKGKCAFKYYYSSMSFHQWAGNRTNDLSCKNVLGDFSLPLLCETIQCNKIEGRGISQCFSPQTMKRIKNKKSAISQAIILLMKEIHE